MSVRHGFRKFRAIGFREGLGLSNAPAQSRVDTKGRDARIWLVPKPSGQEKGLIFGKVKYKAYGKRV